MKKLYALSIGSVLLLQAPQIAAQSATVDSLYQSIYKQEKLRYFQTQTSQTLSTFAPKILPTKSLTLAPEDVDKALVFNKSICDPTKNNGLPVGEGECTETIATTKKIVETNTWLQSTIKDLQLAATSYELGTNPYGGSTTAVLTRIPSITNIWRSATDVYTSPAVEQNMRAGVYSSNVDTLVEAIEDELEKLIEINSATQKQDQEKFIAAVWRYRNGVLSLGNSCNNSQSNKGDGTELQFLTARFCDVETALLNLYNQLPQEFDPPLGKNELIVYPAITLPNLSVILWARSDDVGLLWKTPIEPVLPSVNCDTDYSFTTGSTCNTAGAILGGSYPEEIPDISTGQGLCSHPAAKRGYLCRTILEPNCPDMNNSAGNILLTECSQPQLNTAPSSFSESGPNVCGAAGWRIEDTPLEEDSPGLDDLEVAKCSNCVADLVCGNCPPGLIPKENNGEVIACVDTDYKALSSYVAMAQLVHVRQQCDSPSGNDSIWMQTYNTLNGCCAAEHQAFTTACNAMAEDGLLNGTELDVTSCATIFANNRCGEIYGDISSQDPGQGVCGNSGLNISAKKAIESLQKHATEKADELQLPTTCAEAVNNLDQRSKNIKYSMPKVCSPDCQANYVNTIGNNACYIGSCIEQSLEGNRLTPGRVTWTVQDPSFSWDQDRKEIQAINSNSLVPAIKTKIPPYKPLYYVKQLDESICQLYGLPALTPPSLCSFDARRRTSLPGSTPGLFALDVSQQDTAIDNAQFTLRSLSSGIGARIGAALYTEYFQGAVQSLVEILTDANTILTDMEEANFPQEMCPLNTT